MTALHRNSGGQWVLGIAVTVVIVLFIAAPKLGGLLPEPWDKLGHLLFYGLLAFLLSISLGPKRLITVFIITCLAGMADETYQIFLPDRSPDVGDLLVDFFAALLAVMFAKKFLFLTEIKRL